MTTASEHLYRGVQQTLRGEMQKSIGPVIKRWRYTKSSDFAEVELKDATARFLARLGTLDAGAPVSEIQTTYRELLTDISRNSGDAVGIVSAWLDLFAAGEYGAYELGVCGAEPRCGICALKERCRFLMAGGREERVSGKSLCDSLGKGGIENLAALSPSDLLAFLVHGSECGAADFARAEAALKTHAGLRGLFAVEREELAQLGYAPGEQSRIRALGGLCAQWAGERVERGRTFAKAQDFFDHFHLRLRDLKKEMFYVVMLDQKNGLLAEERISEGTLTDTVVHPREVFASAVRNRAAAIAVVHNHPSGDPRPSSNDKTITKRLAAAAELLGIRLLDHVIVGDGKFTSFVEAGLM